MVENKVMYKPGDHVVEFKFHYEIVAVGPVYVSFKRGHKCTIAELEKVIAENVPIKLWPRGTFCAECYGRNGKHLENCEH